MVSPRIRLYKPMGPSFGIRGRSPCRRARKTAILPVYSLNLSVSSRRMPYKIRVRSTSSRLPSLARFVEASQEVKKQYFPKASSPSGPRIPLPWCFLVLMVLAGCGGESPSPGNPSPDGTGPDRPGRRERSRQCMPHPHRQYWNAY